MAARIAGDDEGRFGVIALMLAREFRRYDFRPVRMHDHVAIAAVRHGDPSQPGLYAVVTNDLGEMRRALAEDFPPDSG